MEDLNSGFKQNNESNCLLKEELRKNIKEIFNLQEKRVLISNEFEIKFKEYLLDAPKFDFEKLKQICKAISEDLNSISKKILDIKANFSPQVFNAKILFNLVEKLQNFEEQKFKLTLDYYICEQERLEKLALTDEFEFIYSEKLNQYKKELNDIKLEINECLEEMRYELYENL